MERLLSREERPIPASYWVAAALSSLAVLVCFASIRWVPQSVGRWGFALPDPSAFGQAYLLIFGGLLGLAVGSAPWFALRWPALGIGLAVSPVLVALIDGTDMHFGVFVALAAVALTAGWRQPAGSLAAFGAALAVVVWWLWSGRELAAPFGTFIQVDYYDTGRRVALGSAYGVALLVALGGALLLRRSARREAQRRELASRAGVVEEQAAVVGERARLARDLHDVVAHHVSLIAVRAETAPYTHPDLGADARAVLADVAADARLALDELRGVLGILGRSGAADRAPQPTWEDLPALIERSRSAGAVVRFTMAGAGAGIGPATGYAAYRVVQEGLTNARKHAPGAEVEVTVTGTGGLLVVRIENGLPPERSEQTAGQGPGWQGSVGRGPVGQGLIGMGERVEALGGRVAAGVVGDRFVVEATFPVVGR